MKGRGLKGLYSSKGAGVSGEMKAWRGLTPRPLFGLVLYRVVVVLEDG